MWERSRAERWAADVTVVDVDTGVYFGKQANANSASGVMFYRIGQYSYLFNGENSENTIQGGFTAGFGGNVTIIYCHKCYCESSNGLSSHLATRSSDADRCCQQACPMIGAWLAGISLRLPWAVCAVSFAVMVAGAHRYLAETLPPPERVPFKLKGSNPLNFVKLFRRGPQLRLHLEALALRLPFYREHAASRAQPWP